MFNALLQQVSAFLDLRKQAVTIAPGLVLATALVIITGTAPRWALRPFACAERTTLVREIKALSEPGTAASAGEAAARAAAVQELAARRLAFEREAKSMQVCASTKACSAPEAFKQATTSLTVPFPKDIGDPRWDASTRDRLIADNVRLAALDTDPVCGGEADQWDAVIANLLTFGLLGLVFGFLLDPVNKALFLQWLPELAAEPDVTETAPAPRTDKRSRRQKRASPSPPARVDDATSASMAARARDGARALPGRMARQTAKLFVSTRKPAEAAQTWLRQRSVQFYIGKGVISDAEYDGLIDRYYRFSELTIGLVLPTLAIGTASWFYYAARMAPWRGGAGVGIALASAVVLARIGVRRHVEFTDKVAAMIDGRMTRLLEERENAARAVDLLALQQLVERASSLLGPDRDQEWTR